MRQVTDTHGHVCLVLEPGEWIGVESYDEDGNRVDVPDPANQVRISNNPMTGQLNLGTGHSCPAVLIGKTVGTPADINLSGNLKSSLIGGTDKVFSRSTGTFVDPD